MKAKKRFGQNFLQDRLIIEQMVEAILLNNPSALLEIGPGIGALTAPLLQRKVQLHCLELDRDLFSFLQKKLQAFLEKGSLFLTQGDVLQLSFQDFFQEYPCDLIFSNLPYNISTPFFLKLLKEKVSKNGFFLVQKEVAQRLCAQPLTRHWGRLSLALSTRFNFTALFDVEPTCFSPAPKVMSTFVKMELKTDPVDFDEGLETLIRVAFSQRRKKISNTLREYDLDFSSLQIDPDRRPEDLTLEDYLKIYAAVR